MKAEFVQITDLGILIIPILPNVFNEIFIRSPSYSNGIKLIFAPKIILNIRHTFFQSIIISELRSEWPYFVLFSWRARLNPGSSVFQEKLFAAMRTFRCAEGDSDSQNINSSVSLSDLITVSKFYNVNYQVLDIILLFHSSKKSFFF